MDGLYTLSLAGLSSPEWVRWFCGLECGSGGATKVPRKLERGEMEASASASFSVEMKVRANLAYLHIQAAVLFARQSGAIESEHGGKAYEELQGTGAVEADQAYVLGAVFSSVAFLEAAINELFNDVVDGVETTQFKELAPEVRKAMAGVWEQDVAEHRTLDKYQAALGAGSKKRLDRGASPYQDVKQLIDLRNALIHYRPEFLPASEGTSRRRSAKSKTRSEALEIGLRGKFPLNPWYKDKGNPFFPYKYLGHGCAEWAVSSSMRFANEFSRYMGISPKAPSLD